MFELKYAYSLNHTLVFFMYADSVLYCLCQFDTKTHGALVNWEIYTEMSVEVI